MIIAKDSPIRRLPVNLNPEQRILLDGIRYSAETVEFTLDRLTNTLLRTVTEDLPHISAFSDAWAFIDSADRFFKFLQRLPERFQCQDEKTKKDVSTLRNKFQHIHDNWRNHAKLNTPFLGYICWVTVDTIDPVVIGGKIHTLIHGSIVEVDIIKPENPAGKTINGPINLISLTVYEDKVYFLDILKLIVKLVRNLESGLSPQFLGLPTAGSDLYLVFHLAPGMSGGSPPTSPDPA